MKSLSFELPSFRSLIDDYSRPGCGDHQHTVVGSEHLVVDVDAHDGVGSHPAGALCHLVHGILACIYKLILIRAGASADEVADAGCKVLDEVHSGDDFPKDYSLVFPDCVALNGRCGCKYHILSIVV